MRTWTASKDYYHIFRTNWTQLPKATTATDIIIMIMYMGVIFFITLFYTD